MPGLLTVRAKVDCAEHLKLPGHHRYRHGRIQVGEMEGFSTTDSVTWSFTQEEKQGVTQNSKTTKQETKHLP